MSQLPALFGYLISVLAVPPEITQEIAAPSAEPCLTMQEAFWRIQEINPQIEGAMAERDLAAAGLMASLSQSRPQVSTFAQFGESDTGRLLNNQQDNQVGLQVTQNLYSFGAIKLAQIGAKEQLMAAEHNIEQTRLDVGSEIGTAILEYLRASAIQKIAVEQEEYYLSDAVSVDERLKAKVITVSEASQIKAGAALATSQRIDATLARDQARARLEVLLDQPVACVSNDSATLFAEDAIALIEEETLDTLIELALRNSPNAKQLQARLRANRAVTNQNRRSNLPNVSLSAFVLYEEQTNFDGSGTGQWQEENRVGINITNQLFTGGQTSARVADSMARLRGTRSDLSAARATLEDQVRRSWVRAQAQMHSLDALGEARENYSIQFDNTKAEHKIGRRTYGEVVESAERYFSAASDEVNTYYQYINNLLILQSTVLGTDALQMRN